MYFSHNTNILRGWIRRTNVFAAKKALFHSADSTEQREFALFGQGELFYFAFSEPDWVLPENMERKNSTLILFVYSFETSARWQAVVAARGKSLRSPILNVLCASLAFFPPCFFQIFLWARGELDCLFVIFELNNSMLQDFMKSLISLRIKI